MRGLFVVADRLRGAGARLGALVPLCTFAAALAVPVRASPPVVLNEVYYDAPGSDDGWEFVELWNAGAEVVFLEGWRLEAGDGARPGDWREVWRGRAGDAIAPGERFVIGEGAMLPPPDRLADLGLENGPDAVRLRSPTSGEDVLGWGPHTYGEYFEGAPAEDVAAGSSLARSPDGSDGDDNARDWIAISPPTPGQPNHAESDAALEPLAVEVSPAQLEPGASARATATAVNRGLEAISPGALRAVLWAAPVLSTPPLAGAEAPDPLGAADSLVAWAASEETLEPGASTEITLRWSPPAAGAYRLTLALETPEDGIGGNDRAVGWLRVGRGPLVVSEILYAPAAGAPEWVEVRARGAEPVDLSRFRLEDATGRSADLDPGGPVFLAPGSLAVLTADAATLLAVRPGLDPARVHSFRPWPALNNGPSGETPFADRVILRDDRGVVADGVEYAGEAPTGYSLERRDPEAPGAARWNWGVSALEGGTPLAANTVLRGPPGEASLALSARSWRRPPAGPPRLSVSYRLAWERARVRLRVLDARGRERRRLFDGPSAARGSVPWDGRDAGGEPLSAGTYVVLLEARPVEGAGRLRVLEPVVLLP